jgi:hypothetical protein
MIILMLLTESSKVAKFFGTKVMKRVVKGVSGYAAPGFLDESTRACYEW